MWQTFDVFGINHVATNYQAIKKDFDDCVLSPPWFSHPTFNTMIGLYFTLHLCIKIIDDHLGSGRHIRM